MKTGFLNNACSAAAESQALRVKQGQRSEKTSDELTQGKEKRQSGKTFCKLLKRY